MEIYKDSFVSIDEFDFGSILGYHISEIQLTVQDQNMKL